MKRTLAIMLALIMVIAVSVSAGELPKTQISKILEHGATLNLTEAQVKKLEIIHKNAVEKMIAARAQADIRMQEIEKFTSDWTNLNGTAVRQLIQEYYDFMATYKSAEVDAIIQARATLKSEQLIKYQQLASIDALMIFMERELVFN